MEWNSQQKVQDDVSLIELGKNDNTGLLTGCPHSARIHDLLQLRLANASP